jgi:pyridoxine 5-phosphate synthase
MNETYLRLGGSIDHVATLRNARGDGDPDPLRAARRAAAAGSAQRVIRDQRP